MLSSPRRCLSHEAHRRHGSPRFEPADLPRQHAVHARSRSSGSRHGDSSNVSTLHMSAHAGTHVDAPRHFFDDGAGADALPLEMLLRPRARHRDHDAQAASAPDDLAAIDLRRTSAC